MIFKKGEKPDRRDLGTVSFSLLGVLLILLSIIAGAYISRLARMNYENELKTEKIEKLESVSQDEIDTIRSRIKQIGVESAFKAKETSINISRIFHTRLDQYLEKYSDPKGLKRNDIRVILDQGYNFTIGKKIAQVDEVVPEIEEGGKYEKVSTDNPGYRDETNESFSYEVEGNFDLIVKNIGSGLEIEESKKLSLTVDVPYPFFKNKRKGFDNSLKGGAGHVGRITNYILKTLAQYRTLAGYGMRSDGGIDSSNKPSTDKIITKDDVELAVNLALVFEIAYQYRGVDPEQVENLSEKVPISRQGRIKDLLSTYITDGRIDPGDIISLYYGYGYDNRTVDAGDATPLNLTAIIVQSINALVDQFIIKYFDKMGMMKIVNALYKGYQAIKGIIDSLGDTGDSIVDFLTGEDDEDEINPKQVKLVKNWVKNVFISAGLSNTNLIRSDYTPFEEYQGRNISGYPNLPSDFSKDFTFEYVKKLTSKKHRWYEYTCGHWGKHREHGHTCNKTIKKGEDQDGRPVYGRCGAEEEIVGYDYMEGETEVTVKSGPISFQPRDILDGYKQIWQNFYDDHYKEEMENRPDNIRGAVKDIIQKIVESIMEEEEIQRMLRKYSRVEIDPRDRRSIFKDMQQNVNSAVEDVIGFYRKNPGEIADIIKEYMQPGEKDPCIQDLKAYLPKLAFEQLKILDVLEAHHPVVESTASMLLDEESPYFDFETTFVDISQGGLNEGCDEVDGRPEPSTELSRKEVSNILENGGSESGSKLDKLEEDLVPGIKERLTDILLREVEENDKTSNRSTEDGLIIQALDYYQYNTSIESYSEVYQTRGGTGDVWIESITPDPATRGEDVVYFIGNTTLNHTSVKWKSDKDGHLSNKMRFNLSSIFLTTGEHQITLSITDEDGIIHTVSQNIYVNIPPDAVIDEMPNVTTEAKTITCESGSSDVDGNITEVRWNFGDGTNKTGDSVQHTYMEAGTYEINLTVTDDSGASDHAVQSILVDDAPRITGHDPVNTDGWKTDQSLTIYFSESVDPASLNYSIEPDADLNSQWAENDTVLTLGPQGFFERERSYNLAVQDIKDIDNGTNSSILSTWSLVWNTEPRGSVTDWLPGDNGTLNLQSTLILSLSEPAYLSGDVDDLVSQDYGWEVNWSDGRRKLKLDHEPFPPSTEMDLVFDLSVLKADQDGSHFKHDGGTSYSISFTTEGKDPPYMVSIEPVNGSKNVSLDKEIILEFDEKINTSSFSLNIYPSLKNLTYTWNEGNDSVKVGHDDDLIPDRRYTFFVICNDTDGNALMTIQDDQNSTNPFHLSTVDPSSPEIEQVVPNDGTDHFLADSPIIVVFNESIKRGSVEFNCTPDPGYWSKGWNPDGTILTLEHADFISGEDYRFTVEQAVDLNGNELEENRTVEFAISRHGTNIGSNLFQKKVWSFIGGGSMGGSLFDMTERILKKTTSEMIHSSNMKNTEYRIPLNTKRDFSYSTRASDTAKELEFLVDIYPNYLNLSEKIEISSPSGHHYTNILKTSSRPFRTTWDIKISSANLVLNVSKKDPYYLDENVRTPLFLNSSHELALNLSLTVSSGWKLSYVDYSVDRFDLSDVTAFLKNIWKWLKKPVSYILDTLQKALDLFDNLVQKLKDSAAKIVNLVGELVQYLIKETMKPMVGSITDNIEVIKKMGGFLSLLGLDMDIKVYESGESFTPEGASSTEEKFVEISPEIELRGTSFDFELYVLEDNIIGNGEINVGSLELEWQIDPLGQSSNNVYSSWFKCQGKTGVKGDGAFLNLTVPGKTKETEEKTEVSAQQYLPWLKGITFPIGPVVLSDFDIGVELKYLSKNRTTDIFAETLKKAFSQSTDVFNRGMGIDEIIAFAKTFVSEFIDRFLSLARSIVTSLSLFFQCSVNGVDIGLNFGLNSGQSIADFMGWIAKNVRNMVQSIAKMRPSCPSQSFPTSILEDAELSVEAGFEEFESSFSANIPALAAPLGKDLGDWKLSFGIKNGGYELVSGYICER